MTKVTGNGKAHVGKMDDIPTDAHLDTKIKICTTRYECYCPKAIICRRNMGGGKRSWQTSWKQNI